MFNKLVKLGIAGIVGITLSMAAPIHAADGTGYASRNITPMNQIVLEPGWRSSCSSNFVVENLGEHPAVIQITMGRDGMIEDRIHQWDKRGYDLVQSLSFAKQLGKTVDIDDVAMIKNLSKDSKVSIHC
ncbi:MAG: hypothetical protein VW455_13950 [Nitrospinota bacterium]